ncbi:MAG: cotA pig [Amycolatopsis sp.]|uniref:multicopper oxidase family protein n=1 Tax=Amycolatopsis sp. TaxID=37632 RepID=UPI0026363AEB|nr:multicopper oxidase domain-containing protein [Amycolatopsis sp.]MCU1681707.1 cotA pig [Amycolatopsis sp.]
MNLNRRRFLGLTGLTVAGGATAVALGSGFSWGGALDNGEPGTLVRSGIPLPPPFQVPLPIPPVLRPVRSDASADYYEIPQQVSTLEILPGVKTEAWTYGGTFPGPTLVSRSGRRMVVKHRNELPRPVVVHLHGGHTPSASDGYPGDTILPLNAPPAHEMMLMPGTPTVGTRDYTYPSNQRAATLWYHDHSMGFTGPMVWLGLAGFHLVHDDEEDSLPLPKGDRDLPLMITDRAFTADGRLDYPALAPNLSVPGVTSGYLNGVLGDVVLVNGAPWPVLDVKRLRYRLRLLNASNCRRYRLQLDPPPPGGNGFVQVGGDGGLLAAPLAHDAIEMASAERFDVVVDFSRYPPGTRVRLLNTFGTGRTVEVMRFDVAADARAPVDDATVPPKLSTIVPLDPGKATVTREFLFQSHSDRSGWTINGQPYEPGHPLATPRLGDTEIWRFVSDVHHPIHLHLDQFQVLARNGGKPGPYDQGWKDTVDVRAAESAEIAVRFNDYAGRYVFHCHNLEHEDMAMMADFTTS